MFELKEPKGSLRRSEAIPMASSSSSASGVSESSIFEGMHGSKATFGSYLKYVGSHPKRYFFGRLLFGYLSFVMPKRSRGSREREKWRA